MDQTEKLSLLLLLEINSAWQEAVQFPGYKRKYLGQIKTLSVIRRPLGRFSSDPIHYSKTAPNPGIMPIDSSGIIQRTEEI